MFQNIRLMRVLESSAVISILTKNPQKQTHTHKTNKKQKTTLPKNTKKHKSKSNNNKNKTNNNKWHNNKTNSISNTIERKQNKTHQITTTAYIYIAHYINQKWDTPEILELFVNARLFLQLRIYNSYFSAVLGFIGPTQFSLPIMLALSNTTNISSESVYRDSISVQRVTPHIQYTCKKMGII